MTDIIKDNPYYNPPIESFHSILKKELIYQSKSMAFGELKKSLFKYIDDWYNKHRVRKKLSYIIYKIMFKNLT